MPIAFLGLAVNLAGLACFAGTVGGAHRHCMHGHAAYEASGDDAGGGNMRGLFLHVLVDTVGSVRQWLYPNSQQPRTTTGDPRNYYERVYCKTVLQRTRGCYL